MKKTLIILITLFLGGLQALKAENANAAKFSSTCPDTLIASQRQGTYSAIRQISGTLNGRVAVNEADSLATEHFNYDLLKGHVNTLSFDLFPGANAEIDIMILSQMLKEYGNRLTKIEQRQREFYESTK